ncbi:MAG: VWA domain-containing protein [Myxococcales bacterium]|nr:VWA domain-containing protein [Myxococcales bacterium]
MPLLDPSRRLQVLVLGALVSACAPTDNLTVDQGPGGGGTPPRDAGQRLDAGSATPRDAGGLDAGGAAPRDAGFVTLSDGQSVPRDAGATGTGPERERCDDGLDNDRDGRIDEDCPCLPGDQQPCFQGDPALAGSGRCNLGTQSCMGEGEFGTWSACMGAGAPGLEVCDTQDNDCDGEVDEGCICRIGEHRGCYGGAPLTRNVGLCRDGNQTCVMGTGGQNTWSQCVGQQLPAPEICDGFDNDCDGMPDNGCQCRPGETRPCYEGASGTMNVGVCRAGVQRCVPGTTIGARWGSCEMQTLASAERCDDQMDNDCDGRADCLDAECMGTDACRPCRPGGERFTLSSTPAEVMFVVDRSSSMTARTSDGSTRWNSLTSAVRAVLPGLESSLSMGLVIFPDPSGCSVPTSPRVPITTPSASVISSYLAAGGPNGTTPTTQALDSVIVYFSNNRSTRRRYVVLATDGAPNCGFTVNDVISRLGTLRSLGADTFVLGIPGTDTSLRTPLNQMADAGGRPRAGGTRFYEANNTAEFESALRAITASASSCVYRFSAPPSDPSRVSVLFDGVVVARNRTSGWDYTDTTSREIRFYGASCDRLQSGAVRAISASFGCE